MDTKAFQLFFSKSVRKVFTWENRYVLLIIVFKNVFQMFVISWLFECSFLGSSFAFQMLWYHLNTCPFHWTNTLLNQIFFNFVVIDSVDCNTPPPVVEFFIDFEMGRFIIEKQKLLFVQRSCDCPYVFVYGLDWDKIS